METIPDSTLSVVQYQCSRKELIWIWWKRMMLNWRTVFALSMWAFIAMGCLILLPDNLRGLGLAPLILVVIAPLNVFQLYAKQVDSDPAYTDPKTLQFNGDLIIIIGPNWKSVAQWSRFNKISENTKYFFLFVTAKGLPFVFPKAAFTAEQQADFRRFAEVNRQ